MKILRMDFFFLLPDDFSGDYNDALRELIKYREESSLPSIPMDLDRCPSQNDCSLSEKIWDSFLAGIEEGRKFSGNVVFGKWNDNALKWEPIEL